MRQKLLIGIRQFPFSPRPRHSFNPYPAIGALYTAHQVDKKHREPPQGDELKTAFVQAVIKGCRLFTAIADGPAVASWEDIDLDALFPIHGNKTYLMIHKRLEFIALI
ncbi:hypothetical protein, partial [Thiolapillus sp.]|uniref:hypothetical protein n=2 Tax=Thiolapillus sp. TaxID=2017437 RepID=UPI003AF97CB5